MMLKLAGQNVPQQASKKGNSLNVEFVKPPPGPPGPPPGSFNKLLYFFNHFKKA